MREITLKTKFTPKELKTYFQNRANGWSAYEVPDGQDPPPNITMRDDTVLLTKDGVIIGIHQSDRLMSFGTTEVAPEDIVVFPGGAISCFNGIDFLLIPPRDNDLEMSV